MRTIDSNINIVNLDFCDFYNDLARPLNIFSKIDLFYFHQILDQQPGVEQIDLDASSAVDAQ